MMVSIGTIVRQLYRYKTNKPLTGAVFLVIGCLAFGGWFLGGKTAVTEVRGILGGPSDSLVESAQGAGFSSVAALGANSGGSVAAAAVTDASINAANMGYPDASVSHDALVDGGVLDAAVKDSGAPVGPAFDRSGTISYKVQPTDTLSRIASYFGISVDTIVNANPGVRANALKAGQALNILPTSGVVYKARSGDTLLSISNTFGISQDKIAKFNGSVDFSSLDPGTSIIIPGGKNASVLAGAAGLPNYNSEFVIPTNGYDWGILHHYNAVDIANSCGTPVVAAAEGLVVPDESIPQTLDGWNEGYGNFVLIEHPFGNDVRTRYAHLEKVLVQIGDYVKQGQEIGLMGETGDATGCHVHFEIYGAQNPFAKG